MRSLMLVGGGIVWPALLVACVAVVLGIATAVTAWRLRHRPPRPEPPPSPEDSEHSWGDHESAGVYREHLS